LLISAATPWQAKDGKAIRAVVVKDTKELFAAIAQVVKAVKMGYRLVPEVGTVPPEGIDKD